MMAGERGPRWTEPGSDATPLLRELLKREQDDAPSDAKLQELASKIANSLQTMPTGGAGQDVRGDLRSDGLQGSGLSTSARLWLGLGVVAVLAMAFSLRSPDAFPTVSPAPESGAPRIPAPAAAPASSPNAVPAPPIPVVASPAGGIAHLPLATKARPLDRSTATRIRRADTAQGPADVAPPVGADLEDEIEILRRARALLLPAPERALELVAEHLRDHRNGTFAEEREAIAIEALVRLGDMAGARRRAGDFVAHFPHSAYQRRLDAVLTGL